METCTFDDYQQFKKYEDSHPECDYVAAECTYKHLTQGIEHVDKCRVRRKGFTSWESMGAKPSYKIKFSDDLKLGNFYGSELEVDRVTLNNMRQSTSWSGLREVEAYEVYRAIGFPDTPIATHAQVRVFKGDREVSTHSYAMVENVNDGTYLKKFWRNMQTSDAPSGSAADPNYVLFEADNTGFEFKKAKGSLDNSKKVSMQLVEDIINREGGLSNFMIDAHMVLYYIGEMLIGHWDGACLRYLNLNYYIGVASVDNDLADGGDIVVRYIPKGLDRVFQGCVYDLMVRPEPPYCGPVQQIIAENPADFEAQLVDAEASAPYTRSSCASEVGYFFAILLPSAAVPLLILLALRKKEIK
jgi:hypothetical protein